jgi:ubiquinone/menaquinone biosynthesis C-methylase UbiE
MPDNEYLMESDEEAFRLDIKTVAEDVERQALWAGIKPGMRVADISCGSGKTTAALHGLVQPEGTTVGIDRSEKRIAFAQSNYGTEGIEFQCRDVRNPLEDLGSFDFVWIRFFLEYYRSSCFKIVQKISKIVKPGGILCLIDLDHNSLNHYSLSDRLEQTIFHLARISQEKADFDPYAGRKLYSHLSRLDFTDIKVDVAAHHLIYGPLSERDAFNWSQKLEVAASKLEYAYDAYAGGFDEFKEEFRQFLMDPRRFTYTPIICCRGKRPRD